MHSWCTLPAPTLSALQQPKTYINIYKYLWATQIFPCQQPRTYIYIHPSCTLPPANNTYICPHKVTFHRCFVVGCIFLWQLSYIYKPLNIIEMMSNYVTNNKVRLCVHITRLFKDPGCWSILRDSHATNKIVRMH